MQKWDFLQALSSSELSYHADMHEQYKKFDFNQYQMFLESLWKSP